MVSRCACVCGGREALLTQQLQEQALARALLKRKEERQQPRSSEVRSTPAPAHEPGGDGVNRDAGGVRLPKIAKRAGDAGAGRGQQGGGSLLEKTGGSQIPKQGVALLPVVPPVLKKWALEKERVENRVNARKEYADKVRHKLKPKVCLPACLLACLPAPAREYSRTYAVHSNLSQHAHVRAHARKGRQEALRKEKARDCCLHGRPHQPLRQRQQTGPQPPRWP